MADTPQQAEVRRQLAARGNQLAPRTEPATRPGRATERRAVISGAAKGAEAGPAGVAVGAARGRQASRARPAQTATRASSSPGPRRSSRGGSGFTIKPMTGPASGALFAEYFGAALVIVLELFTKSASEGYLGTMSKVMMRLTALTAVFFVLFLMTGSKRGGQAAIWFGLLVDLGVIFTAARGQTFSTAASEVSGQGSGITLDAAGLSKEASSLTAPHPEQTQLPDE